MQRLLLLIAEPMLPTKPALDPAERQRVGLGLADFLTRQIGALPHHLSLLVSAGLLSFEWLPLLRFGRPFTALDSDQRRRRVAKWSTSRMQPKRDLLKMVRSCALLFYLDHPIVRARLEKEAASSASSGGSGAR